MGVATLTDKLFLLGVGGEIDTAQYGDSLFGDIVSLQKH